MAKIILYSNDVIGEKMAGPGIRYVQLAKALSLNHDVLLMAPGQSSYKNDKFKFSAYQKPKNLVPLIKNTDVIIAQKLPPVLLKALRTTKARYITDFYDPIVLENLEANRNLPVDHQEAIYNFEQANQSLQLACADHILVASQRQRDFWLGTLIQLGRLIPQAYSEDVSLNNLISIVPFGIDSSKVRVDKPEAIKALVPNFSKTDRLVLWGGGIWNWFDPLSVIEAIESLKQTHPEIKLLFLGTKHPNPDAPEMKMTAKAVKLATDMNLVNKRVFFNYSWVPYEERHNYVFPCWAAVSTHFNHAETRISFRTRIVDSYIWANLPIIATIGDSMADLIDKRQLGLTVDYTDAKGIATALKTLAENEKLYQDCRTNLDIIRPEFYWENVVEPINQLIEKKNWSEITLDSFSFNRLIANYYKQGLAKVLSLKGRRGLVEKILRK